MNEQKLQLIQISVTDLRNLISDCVATELQKVSNPKLQNPESVSDELLSRDATGKLLGVSLTTLFHWNNDNTLPAQKIGGRVYYQKSVIMNKLNNVA
ncbi:hypothetical protein [Flavobacterium sp.]|uniref:helix-turn-helix transcriptional regulator n=1 Tax=Flavobacterium sp. XS2P14 TaxID=3401735 RepID=UPI00286B6F6F|nr:hypothetical protein [Flavobacterium sp.]